MKNKEKRADAPIFGRRLRQARKWAGLPQDRLGVAIGLDETTSSARISRYETGVHEPPIATAKLLAVELGVPLAFLYCDDDDLAAALLNLAGLSATERRRLLRQMDWRLPE